MNEQGLVELKELTFAVDPATLRLVADFLSRMAEELDAAGLGSSHRHIETGVRDWRNAERRFDVIVMPPAAVEK